MSTILYLIKAEKTAKRKLKDYEEKQELDPMFGRPPHTFADSMTTSMGLMLVMATEFMLCAVFDLCLLTGLLLIIYG